jgi:hypothetical protein
LALVPVRGVAHARSSARHNGARGMRTPTCPSDERMPQGTSARAGRTSVRGPGQKRSINVWTTPTGGPTRRRNWSRSDTRSGSGAVCDRPLMWNTFAKPRSDHGSAASPYNVSVGTATTPPLRTISRARSTSAVPGERNNVKSGHYGVRNEGDDAVARR